MKLIIREIVQSPVLAGAVFTAGATIPADRKLVEVRAPYAENQREELGHIADYLFGGGLQVTSPSAADPIGAFWHITVSNSTVEEVEDMLDGWREYGDEE